MISPMKRTVISGAELSLDDFEPDLPKTLPHPGLAVDPVRGGGIIDGVIATALVANADPRGALYEILTTRDGSIEPIVHVYQVLAAPGSIRAGIYHRHQHDRLTFLTGCFDVVLYDIRAGSPTMNRLNVFRLGEEQPCLLRIPPFVIHGVRNAGSEVSSYLNMPTKVYNSHAPDKYRIPWDDPRIPYSFDAS